MANHVIAQGAQNSIIRFFQDYPSMAFELFEATQKGDVKAQEEIMIRIIATAVRNGYTLP